MKKRIIVLGAGHNGLICATYLAKAGYPVTVLEKRPMVGGCAVTEELWPGYKVSRASYLLSLMRPQIIKDLELKKFGLKLLPRKPWSSLTITPSGKALSLGDDHHDTLREISRHSPRDGRMFPEYEGFLKQIVRAVEPMLDCPPPSMKLRRPSDLKPYLLGALAAFRLGKKIPEALRLMMAPASETLDEWFESEILKCTLATDAVIGAFAGPSSPGTGYVLFHHVMSGPWSYVQGGMGALSEALRTAAERAGVTIYTGRDVEFIGKDLSLWAVYPKGFPKLLTDTLVSSLDPHATLRLFDPAIVPLFYQRKLNTISYESPVVKVNLALSRLPTFKAAPGHPLTGTIHLGAETMSDIDEAFVDAASGEPSVNPMVEMTIPSVLDKTVAPEGKHVASLFCQYAPILPGWDPRWPEVKERITKNILRVVEDAAPGFTDSIEHMETLATPELESIFGLTGGNIFHGAMTLDRLSLFRPTLGWAGYETPMPGLFLCGSGTHPGGGVMGAPGRNAARVVQRRIK